MLNDNLPVLHSQHPIRDVKPAVVVGHGDDGFALFLEFRQQRFIEIATELRGLSDVYALCVYAAASA